MKKIYFLVFVFFLVLISGCVKESSTGFDTRIKTGTRGLQVSFVNDIPYNGEVYENENFMISANLKNDGGYDIESGYLALIFDKSFVEFAPGKSLVSDFASLSEPLKGRSFGMSGESKRIDIDLRSKYSQLSRQPSSIVARGCYDYKTDFIYDICIDPDINQDFGRKKSCYYKKDFSFSGGQGAPVSITGVEFKRIPYSDSIKPVFVFTLANNEGGIITEQGSAQDVCSGGVPFENVNKLRVDAKINDMSIDCNVKQSSRDSPLTVECESSLVSTSQPAGYEELSLSLYYTYVIETKKDINIIKKE
jgi:hypothetical protein